MAAVASGLLLPLAGMAPAWAAGPVGSVDSPAAEANLTSLPVRVHGTITASVSGRPVTFVQLQILQVSTNSVVSQQSWTPNAHAYTVDAPFSITSNGRYHLIISAKEDDGTLGGGTQSSTPIDQFFNLDVPPAPPTGVKAAVGPDRAVSVTWDPNAEPDLVGYAVQRSDSAGSWSQIGTTDASDPAQVHPHFDDATTKDGPGGTISYRILALRRASSPAQLVQSDPSTEARANVPAATTPTTAPQPSGGPNPAGDTVAAPSASAGSSASSPGLAKAGKVDLSQFSSLLDKARKSDKPGEAPDPGFGSTLPFKPGSADVKEDGEGQQTLGSGDSLPTVAGIDVKTALPFVAGSLLLTVLLMHVLFVKSELRRADALEALVPEADGLGVDNDLPAPV